MSGWVVGAFANALNVVAGTGLFNVQYKYLNDNEENIYCKITTNKPKECVAPPACVHTRHTGIHMRQHIIGPRLARA